MKYTSGDQLNLSVTVFSGVDPNMQYNAGNYTITGTSRTNGHDIYLTSTAYMYASDIDSGNNWTLITSNPPPTSANNWVPILLILGVGAVVFFMSRQKGSKSELVTANPTGKLVSFRTHKGELVSFRTRR